ncbi:FkbO/Hyg5 family chorismatase [Streptosporangium sp. CA-135522]|uniref:FkbO/Hyg5 family chorismatase n=1 Tax=Streptosporangium sp. CA-135522 TaxID=3240072 RepID=UPI003D935587
MDRTIMNSTTSLAGLDCSFDDAAAEVRPDGNVLGVIEYSNRVGGPLIRDGYPHLAVPMSGETGEAFAEVWRTTADVTNGRHKGLAYSYDGEYLFCCGRIQEDPDYVTATEATYLAAFELIDLLDYPNVVRMWNMVEQINDTDGLGHNVYTQFCRGRAQAFERRAVSENLIPAATCVGNHGGGIAFYFIASRSAEVTNIENPRQVPAYRYPPKYGIKAPSFARATYLSPGRPHRSDHLFVSGTASIIGSETVHGGDVERQCITTLENISVLIGQENLAQYGIDADLSLKDLDSVKVYVKHGVDVTLVRQICSGALSEHAEVAYVNVDICRDDLLVEIEGIVPAVRPAD